MAEGRVSEHNEAHFAEADSREKRKLSGFLCAGYEPRRVRTWSDSLSTQTQKA